MQSDVTSCLSDRRRRCLPVKRGKFGYGPQRCNNDPDDVSITAFLRAVVKTNLLRLMFVTLSGAVLEAYFLQKKLAFCN